jgi:predicted dienelactone hydrolase
VVSRAARHRDRRVRGAAHLRGRADRTRRALRRRLAPLVILSHGNWGTWFSQGWLATQLVDAGYLVLSLEHPGTSATSRTTGGRVRLWDRAADISRALDVVLADPTWGPRVDRDRIGFVGHSFGAWTGVALAGGVYQLQRQRDACRRAVKPDVYCRGLADREVARVPLDGDNRTWRDPRIHAFVLLAGGAYDGFEPASLAAIDAPMLVGAARFDEVLDPAGSDRLAAAIPTAHETTYDSGHFAFVPRCNWLGRRVRKDLCRDIGPQSRGVIHALVVRDVLAFFASTLPAVAR